VKIGDKMRKKITTEKIKNSIKKVFDRKNVKAKKEQRVREGVLGFRLAEVAVMVALATLVGVLSGSFFTYKFVSEKSGDSSHSKYINEFEEAFNNVIDNYYEDVDKDKLIDAAIDGMVSILDGYTSYMNEEETSSFNDRMTGEYKGIGIEFATTTDGHLITDVFDATPAQAAGIKIGDIIIKIDDRDATTMTATQIAAYIRSDNITSINVVVKRSDQQITLKINKAVVSLPSVTYKTFDKNGKKVGYVNVSLFANNTYDQFKKAVESLEKSGMSSLIIDVRDNSGGYLHIASDMIEMFLPKGKTIYQMQRRSAITTYADETDESKTYPVIVLINGNSASASEILASALNEQYGAKIVGTKSYGKGTVQQPSDLATGGMIKVTTDKWLTSKGVYIDKVGIEPTVKVELDNAHLTNPTDENDNQLQRALEIITE
jgi:carboxyl-terminal processing protease